MARTPPPSSTWSGWPLAFTESSAARPPGLPPPPAAEPSILVFVVTAYPERSTVAFVAALGREIEVVVVDIHDVDAARVRRVRMKHAILVILVKHADSFTLRTIGILEFVVVKALVARHLCRCERHAKVEIEVGEIGRASCRGRV